MHLTCTNMPQDKLRDALDKVMTSIGMSNYPKRSNSGVTCVSFVLPNG